MGNRCSPTQPSHNRETEARVEEGGAQVSRGSWGPPSWCPRQGPSPVRGHLPWVTHLRHQVSNDFLLFSQEQRSPAQNLKKKPCSSVKRTQQIAKKAIWWKRNRSVLDSLSLPYTPGRSLLGSGGEGEVRQRSVSRGWEHSYVGRSREVRKCVWWGAGHWWHCTLLIILSAGDLLDRGVMSPYQRSFSGGDIDIEGNDVIILKDTLRPILHPTTRPSSGAPSSWKSSALTNTLSPLGTPWTLPLSQIKKSIARQHPLCAGPLHGSLIWFSWPHHGEGITPLILQAGNWGSEKAEATHQGYIANCRCNWSGTLTPLCLVSCDGYGSNQDSQEDMSIFVINLYLSGQRATQVYPLNCQGHLKLAGWASLSPSHRWEWSFREAKPPASGHPGTRRNHVK